MDSRHYRFSFPVQTKRDIPSDFLVPEENTEFDRGLFIPQDDKRWFAEQPAYPARLLLLHRRQLFVLTHPSAKENDALLPLQAVQEVEAGRSLLAGWMRFKTADRNVQIRYNTRASKPVDLFLSAIQERWLGSHTTVDQLNTRQPQSFGEEPDLKFRNMLAEALEADEFVRLQYFVEAHDYPRRILGFRRHNWYPGHLLAITSRSRLLWLTDEYCGRRSPYAGSAISSPLCLLQSVECIDLRSQSALVLRLGSAVCWRICLRTIEPEARAFAEVLKQLCAVQR